MDAIYDAPKNETERTWALIKQVSQLWNRLLERKLLKLKLTPERVMILQACKNNDMIPAEVARLLCLTEQTITGAVNRMEKDGLIRRIPKKIGRPYTTLVLTLNGEKARDDGWAIVEEVLAAPWFRTSEMTAVTNKALSVLRDHLAEALHIEVLPRPDR